jgi:hypothetical protein
MAKALQKLLGAEEPMFSLGVIRLEKSTGNSGIDVRLIANITEKAHDIMRQLHLDVKDTTGKELYHALLAAVSMGISNNLLAESDYVLMELDGQLISFNLIDVVENSHHQIPYKRQVNSHGKRSLRGEILNRYIKHARSNNDTTTEIASTIGLLLDGDEWYTKSKA